MKNLTISVEDDVVEKARDAARRQGTTLNEMLRRYLRIIAGGGTESRAADELRELFQEQAGRSGGRRLARGEAYEDRT